MRILKVISRFILGIVFIFSGFVKALDPLGSTYKFSDYFHAFGVDFMEVFSLPLAIFLSSFELVLGFSLILGYRKKIVYWVLFVFMSFFTLLTLILAFTNPVTDCGCFGDAILLTNWETFIKNLVLMLFVLILFNSRKIVENVLHPGIELLIILLIFTGSVFLSVSALRHLPVIDFRPYKVGTHIQDEMIIPEGMPVDEYNTLLYYKNIETGEVEEFTIDNYPEDTLQYEFVTSESKLVQKGYEPAIHDFGIIDPDGFDRTDELLSYHGYSLLMLSPGLEKAPVQTLISGGEWSQLEQFCDDFRFVPVTCSPSDVISDLSEEHGLDYKFYSGDEIMIKTMVRSNPGFMLLKNGTILAKWSYRDFPGLGEWNNKWPELIRQYREEQDPEIMMLIEEGYLEDMNWDLIDFDKTANKVISSSHIKRFDRATWAIYIISVMLVLAAAQFLPSKKKDRRV